MRADIKKQITSEKELQALGNIRTISSLRCCSPVENYAAGESDSASEADRLEQEEKQRILHEGKTWEEHLNEEGIDEAAHRQRLLIKPMSAFEPEL